MAGVAHQDDALQVFAADKVVGHDLLPADLVLFRYGRVAVPRQIREDGIGDALFSQGKQVDVLGSAGFFGRKGQLLLLRERVDAGGFAGVGAPDKGNFRHIQLRQEMQLGGCCQESCRVEPSQCNCRGRLFARCGRNCNGWLGGWVCAVSH